VNHSIIDRLHGDDRVQLFEAVTAAGQSPYFAASQSGCGATTTYDGVERIMLGSNNYLGLAQHPEVIEASVRALRGYGAASTGSRLLNGTMDLHEEFEEEISRWFGTEQSLSFSTGYQTNLGTLAALLGPADAVVVDQFAHASIRDGIRMSRATPHVFSHNDLGSLEDALGAARSSGADQILVAVDSLYSMEGSLAPIPQIAALAREYGAALMVDEAHALGLYGQSRRGWSEECGSSDDVDVTMASLSKATASIGGFITGSRELIAGLRVSARPMLFSTAAVPSSVAGVLAAVRIIRSDEGAGRLEALRHNAATLRAELTRRGHDCGSGHAEGAWSPIVPVHVGDDILAIEAWNRLMERGVYTGTAVSPAVPSAGAILRVCVTSEHTEEHLAHAVDAIDVVLGEIIGSRA
jgi:8-amino-7-oxononanoate synthase